MSSHHIVRDNQEPALIVLSIEKLNYIAFEGLLEWNPIILTSEPLLPYFESQFIHIDGLISSQSWSSKELISKFEIIKSQSSTQIDYLSAAFAYLLTKNQNVTTVVCNVRMLEYLKEYGGLFSLIALVEDTRYVLVDKIDKWYQIGTIIKIMGETGLLNSNDILKKISDIEWKTTQDGFVKLTFDSKIWVGEIL